MARIRSIKPDFFRHAGLYDAEKATGFPLRVAFAGLWTAADREGRFKWSPRELKLDCLPHDEIDFAAVLEALWSAGFIRRYEIDGEQYGYIPSWHEHQYINQREAKSNIPAPSGEREVNYDARTCMHGNARGEGKGREGKGKEEDAPLALVENDDEKELFRRGRDVLGTGSGGLVKRLMLVKGGNIALARAAIEMASTKGDPREYVGAMLKGIGKSGRPRIEETCPPEIYDLLVK